MTRDLEEPQPRLRQSLRLEVQWPRGNEASNRRAGAVPREARALLASGSLFLLPIIAERGGHPEAEGVVRFRAEAGHWGLAAGLKSGTINLGWYQFARSVGFPVPSSGLEIVMGKADDWVLRGWERQGTGPWEWRCQLTAHHWRRKGSRGRRTAWQSLRSALGSVAE